MADGLRPPGGTERTGRTELVRVTQAAPGGSVFQPLSFAMVRAALDKEESRYDIVSDTEIRGWWENGFFSLVLLGDDDLALYVVGRWERSLSSSRAPALARFANEWNADNRGIKAYATIQDGGVVELSGEYTADFGGPVTPAQVDYVLWQSIAEIANCFEAAEQQFVDAVPMDLSTLGGQV